MKILKFTAVWCNSCQKLKEPLKHRTDIEEIDVETDAGEELSMIYNITSLPAIVVIDDEGNEIERSEGTKDIIAKYG
jgi:thioredoxin-related protein